LSGAMEWFGRRRILLSMKPQPPTSTGGVGASAGAAHAGVGVAARAGGHPVGRACVGTRPRHALAVRAARARAAARSHPCASRSRGRGRSPGAPPPREHAPNRWAVANCPASSLRHAASSPKPAPWTFRCGGWRRYGARGGRASATWRRCGAKWTWRIWGPLARKAEGQPRPRRPRSSASGLGIVGWS
jgi:hypothetical protein